MYIYMLYVYILYIYILSICLQKLSICIYTSFFKFHIHCLYSVYIQFHIDCIYRYRHVYVDGTKTCLYSVYMTYRQFQLTCLYSTYFIQTKKRLYHIDIQTADPAIKWFFVVQMVRARHFCRLGFRAEIGNQATEKKWGLSQPQIQNFSSGCRKLFEITLKLT